VERGSTPGPKGETRRGTLETLQPYPSACTTGEGVRQANSGLVVVGCRCWSPSWVQRRVRSATLGSGRKMSLTWRYVSNCRRSWLWAGLGWRSERRTRGVPGWSRRVALHRRVAGLLYARITCPCKWTSSGARPCGSRRSCPDFSRSMAGACQMRGVARGWPRADARTEQERAGRSTPVLGAHIARDVG
jgi:hypothetical protein